MPLFRRNAAAPASCMLPDAAVLRAALQRIDPAPLPGDAERPVFLCNVGWRSGSSLAHRLLASDPRLLLWGEPLGRMGLVARLSSALAEVTDRWPGGRHWLAGAAAGGAVDFATTNVAPDGADLRAGLRALVWCWLAEPARRLGHDRWGLREARFGAAEAVLLHWLFPRARFVVVFRHPFAAYRAFAQSRREQPLGAYAVWPDGPVRTAGQFARLWNRLAVGWNAAPADLPVCPLRHEDIVAGRIDYRLLDDFLELELRENSALGAHAPGDGDGRPLSAWARRQLRRQAGPGMAALGYDGNGGELAAGAAAVPDRRHELVRG